jgi:nucleoside-diphosphate-sugar epimerase
MTGGTGFVGRTLLDYFILQIEKKRQEFEVTVLSRDPIKFLERYPKYSHKKWLRFAEGSLRCLPEPSPHTDIIHAAADTHLQGQGEKWIDQIVNGTAAVLDFAVRAGATRFLNVSSGAVYAAQSTPFTEITEEYRGAPETTRITSTYGQAKRVAEQLCTIYYHEHALQTVNARCFAFCSEHIPLDGPYAIGNFIRDALFSDSIRVSGDGSAVRSYLDGEDFARWMIGLLQIGRPGEAYNVGSDMAITTYELAQRVALLLAPNKSVVVENNQVSSSQKSHYVPSIRKMRNLGYGIQISLNDSISTTATGVKNIRTYEVRPE